MKFELKLRLFFGRKRFIHYNNSIASIGKKSTQDVLFVNSMARLHNLICDIVDDLNACFSLQVIEMLIRIIFRDEVFVLNV